MAKNNTTSKIESKEGKKAEKVSSLSESKKISKEISDNLANPEKEFIKRCDEEIEQIDEEIKKIDTEWEKKLKMIPKMDDSLAESMCLNALTETLSEDEIAIVKKWRTNDDLDEIYDETRSYRDDLAEKVLDWLKNIDEDKKLVFAWYLSKQRIICCSDSDYNFWFYYTDIQSDRCDETIHTLGQLWLRKYVKYVWDSCYNIDSNYVKAAKERLFNNTLSKDSLKAQEELKQLEEESESLESKKVDILKQKEAVKKYWLPVEHALSILEWENSIDRPKDKKMDKENNTYVILSDYSYYSGSGWIEYWVIINVKRWSNTKELKVVYRDAYSSSRDDWSKDYDTIKDVRVQWDKVFVTVCSEKRTQTYEFDIKDDSKHEHLLSTEEQSKFKKRLEEETKRLVDQNTKHDLKYPAIHNFVFRKTPWSFGTDWMHPYNTELPYDQAEVVDEYVDSSKWIAYIVIKTQIDSSWDMWRQFAWIKYEITPKSTTEIERENLRELLLVEGRKPKLRAKE